MLTLVILYHYLNNFNIFNNFIFLLCCYLYNYVIIIYMIHHLIIIIYINII